MIDKPPPPRADLEQLRVAVRLLESGSAVFATTGFSLRLAEELRCAVAEIAYRRELEP